MSAADDDHDVHPVDRAAVFEILPTPYVVLTPDLVVADLNEAYAAVTGRSRESLVGAEFLVAFPPPPESLAADGRSELQVSLERVRDTGRPDTLPVQKYPIAGADGVMSERHWLAVHVPVLDADGRVTLIVQRTEDVTEFSRERERVARLAEQHDVNDEWRRRAQRVEADLFQRARELADAVAAKDAAARQVATVASVALALTSAETLAEVEQIVVGRGLPALGADGGGIISASEDGGWRITVNSAFDPGVRERYATAPFGSPLPGCHVARTGERLLFATRQAGLAYDAETMAPVYEHFAREAWAFLPLVVGDRRLGALGASWVQEHQFSPHELNLLDGFAAQCAQAVLRIETMNARRAAAREVQQLATSLQQALLTPPPEPDQLEIAVRYRPAGHHAQVGGDWYDALLQPGGATMLVIGDVVGHDSVAAAKMGQLRGVLRTLAYDADRADEPDTPAQTLTRLEHVARGLAVDTLATAVLARVETPFRPGDPRTMRWTNAGHPPPVLLHPDGVVQILDTKSDLLLGVDPDAARHDHCVDLPEGATLLLYTDGLVERRDASFDAGMDALRRALTDLASTDVERLCDTVLQRLAPDAGDDDIALLAVRIRADTAAPPTADVVLPHDTTAPALARRALIQHAAALPQRVRDDAELLVSEVVTNAVRYGQPSLVLRLRATPTSIRVEVTDHGAGLPVLPDGRPDPDAPSGRGLLIVAAVADQWGVVPHSGRAGKTVWFELGGRTGS